MARTVVRPSFLFLSMLLAAGCPRPGKSDSGSGSTTPDASSPADAGVPDAAAPDAAMDAGTPDATQRLGNLQDVDQGYCTPRSQWLCAQAAACGCIQPDGQALDGGACVDGLRGFCNQQFAPAEGLLDAGLLVILVDNLAPCLAQQVALAGHCEPPTTTALTGPCQALMSEEVSLGAPCSMPICARGQGWCNQGTCEPLPAPGQPCQGACRGSAACQAGTCVSLGGDDAACQDDVGCIPPRRCLSGSCQLLHAQGGACGSTAECQATLVCLDGGCQPEPSACQEATVCGNLGGCAVPVDRRCAPLAAVDGGCDQNPDCQSGLFCVSGESRCSALPGEGLPCGNGTVCADGLGCSMDTTTCTALPTDGGACALGEMGPLLCAEGLLCVNGVCGTPPGQGQECAMPNACAAPLACDFTSNGSICDTRRPAGGVCQNDAICQDGLFCDYGTGQCTPARSPGAPCSAGNECGSGVCLPDGPGAAHCYPMPGQGDGCLWDCAPGLACRSTPGQGRCQSPLCHAITGG